MMDLIIATEHRNADLKSSHWGAKDKFFIPVLESPHIGSISVSFIKLQNPCHESKIHVMRNCLALTVIMQLNLFKKMCSISSLFINSLKISISWRPNLTAEEVRETLDQATSQASEQVAIKFWNFCQTHHFSLPKLWSFKTKVPYLAKKIH